MVEGGWIGYEILCVLSREGDVGAWVLFLETGSTSFSSERVETKLFICVCYQQLI